MKKYWAHIIMSDKGEEWEGDVMIADEVDTDCAKDKEKIALLRDAIKDCCRMSKWCEKCYGRLSRGITDGKEEE